VSPLAPGLSSAKNRSFQSVVLHLPCHGGDRANRAIMWRMPPRRERLSFDDAQILRLESATIKGHTGKVLVLGADSEGEPLAPEKLRNRVAERIGAFPRLSQRVAMPRLRFGRAAWVDAPEVDLDWHVAGSDAEPLDDAELRGLVGELLSERLDHERPLWRIDVAPLTGGRTALIGRVHHAMADGVSAIRLTGGLLFDPGGDEPPTPGGEQASPAKQAGTPSAQKPASAGEARILVGLPAAVWRELRPGSRSALDQHIGPDREVAWTTFTLERLKRIEHGAGEGFTVNDVVLATVAGALGRWLDQSAGGPGTLRVQVPVCLHAREEEKGPMGNRDSFLNVDLPIAEPDPLTRLRYINAETRERKLDHDAEALYAFFHALGRFRPLYRGVTRLTSGPREFALSVSNVPGPRRRSTIVGHPIEQFCSFAEPADRHALRVSVVSLGGEVAFGLCSDPDAIADLASLPEELSESVAELENEV
jgi:diacylglycerol O-acyltransferase